MLLSIWDFWKTDCDKRERRDKMAASMVESPPPQLITTIEWSMMDKSKFFPLYTLSSFTGIYLVIYNYIKMNHYILWNG